MEKFEFFNRFNSAVMVVREDKSVVFKNNVFKRIFPDFETLEKFAMVYKNTYLSSKDNIAKSSYSPDFVIA